MTTQQMRAHTQSMTLGARFEPSPAALAVRSLRAAERFRDAGSTAEYRAALSEHFAEFVTPPTRACPLRTP